MGTSQNFDTWYDGKPEDGSLASSDEGFEVWWGGAPEIQEDGGGGGGGSAPNQANTPTPADDLTDVAIDQTLSWNDPGSLADEYDVYFYTGATPVIAATGLTTEAYDPGTLQYFTNYFWRIDSINANGTTQGTVWDFTTLQEPGGAVFVSIIITN